MTTLKPPFRAQDMNGLYKRVLKGAYPEIPKKYTKAFHENCFLFVCFCVVLCDFPPMFIVISDPHVDPLTFHDLIHPLNLEACTPHQLQYIYNGRWQGARKYP